MEDVQIFHNNKQCSNVSCQRMCLGRACQDSERLNYRIRHGGVPRNKPTILLKEFSFLLPKMIVCFFGKCFFFPNISFFHFGLLAWAFEIVECSQTHSAFFMWDFGWRTLFWIVTWYILGTGDAPYVSSFVKKKMPKTVCLYGEVWE